MRSSPETFAARPVSTGRYELGEGPRLDPRTGELLWVDIRAGQLLRGRLAGHRIEVLAAYSIGAAAGSAAPVAASGGGWVVAAGRGFRHVSAAGAVRTLADGVAAPGTVMNDGIADPYGRFLAGSQVTGDAPPWTGGLYRLEPDGSVATVLTGVGCANGLGFDPTGETMYHVDSRRQRLTAYRYDPAAGTATEERVLAEFTDATPDGLCVDAEGCLWIAMWDGWSVHRFAPDGTPLARVDLPVPRPTATCLIEGVLVITSAWIGLDDAARRAAPDSGRIFAAEVGVSAAPAHTWDGDHEDH
ncbi:SMP-30/gluconolactonase/LRE family protein [Micromonospora sp. NPDC006431]|uniref:SMP-30/gluconolactonase/LRE family protein n=1 Tax=Micromonospora sp. NPDC006431 TaxID=3364235 RepID=UPI0036AEB86F